MVDNKKSCQIKVKVFDTPHEVAVYTASLFGEAAKQNPRSVFGFATGSTPIETYAEIVKLHQAGTSFKYCTSFNLDEYWGLDGSHNQSYRFFMNTHLFSKIDIQPHNTHCLDGLTKYPALESQAYETKIVAKGGVDLWMAGIGVNGHLAFNEPGSAVDSRTRLVSLTEETIAANSDGRFFSNPAEVPRCALSVGIGTVRDARAVVLLGTGKKKAQAIRDAIEGPFSTNVPASLLQDHPNCTFVLDREAASLLK